MLELVRYVTVDEIKSTIRDILLQTFVAERVNVVVACSSIMEKVCSLPIL